MHVRVDPLNDGHQVVKNVFCVVHCGIHEVPVKEHFRVHNRPLLKDGGQGGRRYFFLKCGHNRERKTEEECRRVKKPQQIQ